MTDSTGCEPRAHRIPVAPIALAAAITILDGFDAFSFSLMAPQIGATLRIPTASLGVIFASVMAGMILGAIAGGALADRLGHLRVLYVALALFGASALALSLVSSTGLTGVDVISLNRLISGMGLGAAAPIAVGLLNQSSERPPSELIIALVWAGIPLGGTLAALYKYAFVPVGAWRSIFVLGGILPLFVGLFAYRIFRDLRPSGNAVAPGRTKVTELFTHGQVWVSFAITSMFFVGYVTTSIIVNWLPTVLTRRAASPFAIFATFGAINAGSVLGMVALGLVAARTRVRYLLPWVWAAAGLCGLAAGIGKLGTTSLALLAIGSYTIGAGAQALSVALANDIYRERGIETTAIGFMTGSGRLGQACALAASGAVISFLGREAAVFGIAGASACVAALFAVLALRSRTRTSIQKVTECS